MSTTCPIKNRQDLEQFKSYYLVEKSRLRNYTLIIFGLNTALRISDILKLRWKDVYCEEKGCCLSHVELIEQKTGKRSIVAMNEPVIQALLMYRQYCAKGNQAVCGERYLFESSRRKESPISRYQAYRIIKEAGAYAGLCEHISCHSLRKTFGYYAWKQGTPPAMLMSIYNHSSYQITKRYLCIDQEDRDEVFLNVKL